MTKPDDNHLIGRLEAVARGLRVDRPYAARMARDAADALIAYEAELSKMASDWCNFCESIGVDVDAHEAVADQIRSMLADDVVF